MECFEKYIGSGFNCSENTHNPPNTLTRMGLSETMVTKVIGAEYATPEDLFADKLEFCYHQLTSHAMQKFTHGGRYANGMIDRRTVGQRQNGTKAGAGNMGFVMEASGKVDTALNINQISLHLQYTGTVDLKIWNLTTGAEIASIPVNVVSGEFQVVNIQERVRFNGLTSKIAIGYDADGITSFFYKTTTDCTRCPSKPSCGPLVRGYGGVIDLATGKVTRTGHSAGMTVDYSLECDYEGFICANSRQLSTPLLYHIGAEIATYALTGDRFTDHTREQWEKALEHCAENYEASLVRSLKNIKLPNNDCYGCRSRFAIVNVTP